MPPERFDWSDRHAPQAASPQAGLAPAGLAEAAPTPSGAAPSGAAAPDLVVRTRRSVHQFQPGSTYRIGRDPDSDIVMTDSRVSWRHGVLRTDGDAWVFEDLRSTNGTFVGMQRVDRAAIGNDCVVRLGNPDDGPILRCTPQASAAPAPPAPAPAPPAPSPPRAVEPGPHYEPIPSAQPFPAPDPIRSAEFPVAYLERPVPHAPSWAAPAAKPDPSPAPAGGGGPARPELLPSVDRRPTARMPLPAKAMRIGRDTA